MNLSAVIRDCIEPAYKLLPAQLRSDRATVLLLAIGQQESRFEHAYQVVAGNPDAKGPARGYWQFELGTADSRGGVWGVYLHEKTGALLEDLCKSRKVPFAPSQIWRALETDHVLAAGVARLMLLTDAKPLPPLNNPEAAWQCYAKRTWHPGKPHRETWDGYYANAMKAVVA